MGRNLKLFVNDTNYNTWLNSNDYVTPYVYKIKSNGNMNYQKRLPPLPYDAELLYLESTGEQWINLDYKVWNYGIIGDIVMQRIGNKSTESAYIGRVSEKGFDLYTIDNGKIGLWVASQGTSIDLRSNDTETIDKEIHHVLFDMNENGTL